MIRNGSPAFDPSQPKKTYSYDQRARWEQVVSGRQNDKNNMGREEAEERNDRNGGGWSARYGRQIFTEASNVIRGGPYSSVGRGEEMEQCDIDRVSASHLSVEDFISDYVEKGRPVIIDGAIDDWPAIHRWQKEAFLEQHGQSLIRVVRSSKVVAYRAGQLWNNEDRGDDGFVRNVTVASYINHISIETEEMETEEQLAHLATKTDHDYYFIDSKLNEAIQGDWRSLRYGRNAFEWTEQEVMQRSLFFFGKEHTGVTYHQHAAAFNCMIFGHKEWYVCELNFW